MTSVEVTVSNPLGLHARAAARFVRVASAFASQIRVGARGRTVDGKSILGLLSLAAGRGSGLTISAEGADAAEAVAALRDLIAREVEGG
jgi:phosphocarrier protein HPr